ncbi:MAG: hypothetical protein IPN03_18805 [Holophagales bacterium]|nr:hypothetical protein [Holophagales bacterium]
MIVELPSTTSDYRGGRVRRYRMGFFHFSNNNLALRAACARDLGGYDLAATRSEDVELCLRLARNPDWVALREHGAVVRHKARRTFRGFVKQLWGWGTHLGYAYRKTGLKGFHLYRVRTDDHQIGFAYEAPRLPFLACVFVTDFHLFHVWLLLLALAAAAGLWPAAGAAAAVAIWYFWRALADERRAGLPPGETAALAFHHWIANVTFVTSGVLSGLRHGLLLVPASIFRPSTPSAAAERALRLARLPAGGSGREPAPRSSGVPGFGRPAR